VSHDESFVSVACNSIADVDGGRLQLYQSTPFSRYGIVREERRKAAFAKVGPKPNPGPSLSLSLSLGLGLAPNLRQGEDDEVVVEDDEASPNPNP